MSEQNLSDQFDLIDERIQALEENNKSCSNDGDNGKNESDKSFDTLVTTASGICRELLVLYASAYDKELPDSDDLLVIFKAFVKGDTSLTAVRDNVRELVYYRNCILEDRFDALPKNPEKMALHTIRHIYLYLRSRADQEDLLD
ncbi:MAG: hypothetical protein OEX07_02675 [Gammaproteobacteria bacterium]|nr:hypothetical protein [Gammaproteobacteria bacterium]